MWFNYSKPIFPFHYTFFWKASWEKPFKKKTFHYNICIQGYSLCRRYIFNQVFIMSVCSTLNHMASSVSEAVNKILCFFFPENKWSTISQLFGGLYLCTRRLPNTSLKRKILKKKKRRKILILICESVQNNEHHLLLRTRINEKKLAEEHPCNKLTQKVITF